MKKRLATIFFEERGKPSLKRIVGAFMIANALLGKNALIVYALFAIVDNFDKIDNCLDNLLYGGVALLLGTIADKFFKK